MVLFKFFEQRRLITADNLEYLGNHLKNINRVDLCHLIDEYTNTYLNGSSFLNSESLPVPHPQSIPAGSHPLPASVRPRPPPFNPDYRDHSKSLYLYIQGHVSYVYPLCVVFVVDCHVKVCIMLNEVLVLCIIQLYTFIAPNQPQQQLHHSVQNTYPEQVDTEQECKLPTQVQDDQDLAMLPSDNLMFHKHSEQLHQHNRQLQTELKLKTNDVRLLSRKNAQLQQSLLQIRNELKAEREMSQNQVQIHKHYLAQIEKLSAELQGKAGPAAERYLMRRWPHGIAFIINNYEFSSTLPVDKILTNRDGSVVDEKNLRITWEYLGYKVQVLQNLKATEITNQLMQVALQNHEYYDSFVCCILSHGEVDGVYGTDGVLVKFNDIFKLFKGNFCPSLVNKPKLFFIQACRGDDTDEGVSEQQKDGPEKINNLLPSEADFFFGYATPPGYASWRSTECGTWYISSLCNVLVDNAPQQDLLSMSTMVTDKVSKAYTKEGYKQCPVPVSQLRKQVWFFGNT